VTAAVVARSARLAYLTLGFAVQFAVQRRRRPELLRRYLERCGGGFVKLGQVLAVRYDLLPLRYCDALTDLLDRLAPAPFESIRTIVEAELQAPLEQTFAAFDATPVSTASVAQVHRARTSAGEDVAVKVLRPDAEAALRTDFRILGVAARMLQLVARSRVLDLVGLVDELAQLNREELDFGREARNTTALRDRIAGDGVAHYVPQVFPALSTRRVLTLEWLDGPSVRDVLAAVTRDDRAALDALAAANVRPSDVARTLFQSIITQCFTHRLFHADPHPANMLVLPDGRLGFVDFGMLGFIDEASWSRQFRLNAAIAREEIDAAYEVFLESLEPLPRRRLARLEATFKRQLHQWILASRYPSADLAERSYATFMRHVFDAVRAEGLRMSWMDLRLNRTLMISDIVILALDPEMERLPLLRDYIRDASRARRTTALADSRPQEQVNDLLASASTWPSLLLGVRTLLRDRLPALTRSYVPEGSRASRVMLVLFGYLRAGAAVAALALLAGPWLFGDFARSVGDQPWRWWGFAAAVLTMFVSWQLTRAIERE
jgi:ubiquinone biosynthesis protein